jgi:hypothetical protein
MCNLDPTKCRYTAHSEAPVASSSVTKPMSPRKMVDEPAKKKKKTLSRKTKAHKRALMATVPSTINFISPVPCTVDKEFTTFNLQNAHCSGFDIYSTISHRVLLRVSIPKGSLSGNRCQIILHNTKLAIFYITNLV